MKVLLLVAALVVAISANVNVTSFKCTNTNCEILSVYWPSPTVALMVTVDLKVWRSVDEGITWTQILKQVDWIDAAEESNSSVIYFIASFGQGLNYSTDGGKTIYPATLPVGRKQLVDFQPHPSKAGWVLATSCADINIDRHLCTLYTSQDYGNTWKSAFSRSLEGGAAMWGNSTTEPSLIFVWRSPSGDHPWSYGYTTDFGATYTVIFPDSLGFLMTKHYQFVAIADVGDAFLYASSYRVDPTHKSRSSYKLADFPFGDEIPENHYQFLDDTTRSEYIAVRRWGNANYGTVFSSDFDGQYYQFSLDYVFQIDTVYDFHAFNGLGGIYFANTLLYPEIINRNELTTRVTFDNGGEWRYLTPPTNDFYGRPYNCTGMCALHLVGTISQELFGAPPVKTHHRAIGLAIANGNVGEFLNDGTNPTRTFFSRDAGLTWKEIFNGPSSYEFGDHGGILVIAPYFGLTNVVYYSFDQGATLSTVKFTEEPVWVYNVYTHPGGTGKRFFIVGLANDTYKGIWGLDFGTELTNACQITDYEDYAPSNGLNTNGPACFMGATTLYTRRKPDSICYNDFTNSDKITKVTPCPCTFEDYECAWNFNTSRRNSTDGFFCGRMYPTPPCTPGTTYHERPNGYALIPDTQCQGGLQLEGTEKSCKSPAHPTEVAALVTVSVLVVVAIVGFVGLYVKNERFRNWMQSLKPGGSEKKYREINHTGDEEDDNTPFLSGH